MVLQRPYGSPQIVNDGVTIAREITLPDAGMNCGALLIREVASRSDIKAGDGTTTTTILTQEIISQGVRMVASGCNPVAVNEGINKAARVLGCEIQSLARPVASHADILNIATIASGSKAMGAIIADAVDKVGETGSTVLEESQTLADEVVFTQGLTIDRGYLSPYMIKDPERQLAELIHPRVLVTDERITDVQAIVPLLEQLIKTKEPLLLIADDVSGEALNALVVNKMRGIIDVVAIKAPGFGDRRKEYLQDVAIATGATFVAEEVGVSLDDVTVDMLGRAERCVVLKDQTTIVTSEAQAEAVKERIEQIRRIAADKSCSQYDKDKAAERVASLGGGIARIKVGAATETELRNKKLRYEDALNSVKSAREMGIVPGGGSTLAFLETSMEEKVMAVMEDEDERQGGLIMLRSLSAPMKQIASNAGVEGAVILSKVREANKLEWGWDASKMKYCDLWNAGIVDPAKVTITALENSASVAGLVLTTECLITDIPEDKKDDRSNRGGMMG